MIKQLIEDLAYDKITLGQGLTRAKLIASKTQTPALRDWVNQELQGYDRESQLPPYRVIPCQPHLVISLPFGAQDVTPVSVDDPGISEFYNTYRLHDSVSGIESVLRNHSDQLVINLVLPTNLTLLLAQPFEQDIQQRRGAIRSVVQKIGKSLYEDVIELTKQKLIDTLLELHQQFPNLDNDFNPTRENLIKVKNIVNNHIYGNNNPVNVAAGQDVVQKDITNNVGFSDYSKLEDLGVEKKDIDELKAIVDTNQANKPALKEKAMKWVIPVVTNVTARGLYDHAPQIMDFVTNLIKYYNTL